MLTYKERIEADADYTRAVNTKQALVAAYWTLEEGSPERATIACMLVQHGCEFLEPTTPYLTELCDVIMFG